MATTATAREPGLSTPRLGWAWLALAGALALHVLDEALTGFLNVWNPTAAALHARWPWVRLPMFPFGGWLSGLIILVVLLFVLAPVFFRGGGMLRPPASHLPC